jgi:hypothetical protein
LASLRYRPPARAQRAGAGRQSNSHKPMCAAAQDVALAAMWVAADRRRIGWILSYLRKGVVHHDYRDYAGLLPEGSVRGLLPQFYARYELAQAAALEDLRQAWTPPPVDDAAWEGHLRWMALRDVRRCREWLLPHEKRLSTSKQ